MEHHPIATKEPVHVDRLLVYDTETAGLSAEEGIVEHAWLEIDDQFNILGKMHRMINPPGDISPSAAGVHGITKEMVKDAPSLDQHLREEMGDELASQVVVIIAHNAAFDHKYLAPYCKDAKKLCTLKLCRIAFPKDAEGQAEGYQPPPDHKLPTMMYYLQLTKAGTHNALDDVHTCLQLLQACCNKLGVTLEEAYHLCNKPMIIKKMEFGKHKGKKLSELPKDYIVWALNNMENLDENLKHSLELELGRRR